MKPTLLVMAAGMGSRFGGLKQVEPVGPNGETILEYSVFDAIRADFGKVVFIIKEEIRDVFEEKVLSKLPALFPVELAFQELDALPEGFSVPEGRTKPWGTGHAIWCARHLIKEPFSVLNADDFYGGASFDIIARHLKEINPHATPHPFSIVGYRLGRTLSKNGTVSRGVCKVDESGNLTSVLELTKLAVDPATGRVRDEIYQDEDFDLFQLVSMNFMGFTPALFDELERLFVEFLKTGMSDPKSEFYIPKVVAQLISEKRAVVKMLPTESPWAGVTYKEDKPELVELLRKLTDSGNYPTPLWV